MIRKSIISIITLAGLSFISYQVKAQDSLLYYLKIVAHNNPALKSNYNQYLAALEKVPQIGSLPDPEITFGYFLEPKEEIMGRQIADLQVMQMFPWFGTLSASRKEATSMAQARFYEFSDARNQIFYETRTLYYQIYRLHKEIQFTEKKLENLESLEKISLIQYQTGGNAVTSEKPQRDSNPVSGNKSSMGSMSSPPGQESSGNKRPMDASVNEMSASKGMVSLLEIRMDKMEAANNLDYLHAQLHGLSVRFNTYLNRPTLGKIWIADSIVSPDFSEDSSKFSYDNNAMVQMYQSELQSYQAMLDKSKKMGYPMVGLGIDYMLLEKSTKVSSMDNGKDMLVPMFKITVPVFRKKYKAMQQETQYLAEATSQKQQAMILTLTADLENTRVELNNAANKIRLYSTQIELTQQAVSIQISSFQGTTGNLEDVLRLQQKLLELQIRKTEASVDYFTSLAKMDYLNSKVFFTDEKK